MYVHENSAGEGEGERLQGQHCTLVAVTMEGLCQLACGRKANGVKFL